MLAGASHIQYIKFVQCVASPARICVRFWEIQTNFCQKNFDTLHQFMCWKCPLSSSSLFQVRVQVLTVVTDRILSQWAGKVVNKTSAIGYSFWKTVSQIFPVQKRIQHTSQVLSEIFHAVSQQSNQRRSSAPAWTWACLEQIRDFPGKEWIQVRRASRSRMVRASWNSFAANFWVQKWTQVSSQELLSTVFEELTSSEQILQQLQFLKWA